MNRITLPLDVPDDLPGEDMVDPADQLGRSGVSLGKSEGLKVPNPQLEIPAVELTCPQSQEGSRLMVRQLMKCGSFKKHIRGKGVTGRDASDMQRQVEVWQDLRSCDPDGFSRICKGMSVQVFDISSGSGWLAATAHLMWACFLLLTLRGDNWLKALVNLTDVESEDESDLNISFLNNMDVYAAAIGLYVVLDSLLWMVFRSYLAPMESPGVSVGPPTRLRLLSILMDVLVVQFTMGVGLVVNLVRCLFGKQHNTFGQRVMEIVRLQEVTSVQHAC